MNLHGELGESAQEVIPQSYKPGDADVKSPNRTTLTLHEIKEEINKTVTAEESGESVEFLQHIHAFVQRELAKHKPPEPKNVQRGHIPVSGSPLSQPIHRISSSIDKPVMTYPSPFFPIPLYRELGQTSHSILNTAKSEEQKFNIHSVRDLSKPLNKKELQSKTQSPSSPERPHQCPTCHKRFIQRWHLTSHLRTHTGERPYRCRTCGKDFSQQSILLQHYVTHSNERPYPCTVCGKDYKYKWHLTNHMRSHTGERPYRCTMCGKSFMCTSGLQQHQIIHTGERNHCCPLCGKDYIHKWHLKSHLKTHKLNTGTV